ncbi:MAG: hypothetical protein QOK19_2211 [Solirubrobacteraceae bacterium]|nr:hypothetical protein [Solirubrobacteraceae bacterium]
MSKTRLPRRAAVCLALLGSALLSLTGLSAAQAAAPLPTLKLSLTKGAIAVSGSTVSGAVNVAVTSATDLKEPSPLLIRLNPGATVAEFEALLNSKAISDPNNISKVGAMVFDASGTPGATNEVQTELKPGNYIALNVEGESPTNPPHVAFTVTASPSPAVLPAPAATIKSIDFAFKGPSTLKVGQLVRFENEGFLVHMDFAAPVKSKKAALKAIAYFKVGKEKAVFKLVSGEPVSFFGPLSTGGIQQETITAKPGWYVQTCFMDTQDHRQHTRLGMVRLLHIVK